MTIKNSLKYLTVSIIILTLVLFSYIVISSFNPFGAIVDTHVYAYEYFMLGDYTKAALVGIVDLMFLSFVTSIALGYVSKIED